MYDRFDQIKPGDIVSLNNEFGTVIDRTVDQLRVRCRGGTAIWITDARWYYDRGDLQVHPEVRLKASNTCRPKFKFGNEEGNFVPPRKRPYSKGDHIELAVRHYSNTAKKWLVPGTEGRIEAVRHLDGLVLAKIEGVHMPMQLSYAQIKKQR